MRLRLKLAVQKSGRLTDPSLDLLTRCGLKLSRGKDQLMGFGENMPLDVLFVRDDDIPGPGAGGCLRPGARGPERAGGEAPGAGLARPAGALSAACARSISAAAGCRSRFRKACTYEGRSSLRGKRIATTYPYLLERYLRERDICSRHRDAVRARWRSRRASGARI